jgi:hypothetical protein
MKGQYYSQPTFNDAPMVQFTKSNAFVFQLTKYLPWTTNTFSTVIPSKVTLQILNDIFLKHHFHQKCKKRDIKILCKTADAMV